MPSSLLEVLGAALGPAMRPPAPAPRLMSRRFGGAGCDCAIAMVAILSRVHESSDQNAVRPWIHKSVAILLVEELRDLLWAVRWRLQ